MVNRLLGFGALALLVATSIGLAVPTGAFAQGMEMEPTQHGFTHGPDFYAWRMQNYQTQIMHMSPDNRMKLMAMQDKLMQMEMDHASMTMKMEMETAKMRREIEMFILTAGSEGH